MYDPHLVDRARELLADRSEMTEKKMFGGLALASAVRSVTRSPSVLTVSGKRTTRPAPAAAFTSSYSRLNWSNGRPMASASAVVAARIDGEASR